MPFVIVVVLPVTLFVIGWFAWAAVPKIAGLALPPAAPGAPKVVLLVGSDARADLAGGGDAFGGANVKGRRSDALILLTVPRGGGPATLVSIPRDLRTEVPGRGISKINSAYGGGPQRLVEAVQNATGLTVNHYVEVDFDGFRGLSTALGGVQVCPEHPIRDAFSNLDLPAGCQNISGDTALAWVRSRQAEQLIDGRWRRDLAGDFSRMQRQQEFLRALFDKAAGPTTLVRFPAVAFAASGAFSVDETFGYPDAIGLGFSLATRSVQFATLPSEPRTIGGVAFVVKKSPEAEQFLDTIRSGSVPAVPSTGGG